MALRDVIIGYAKGDKGDKGDTGERGATGQTGPQGEPGNIADAEITDTQGLDVDKGAKTTAQKLFDAITDRIVNKLVSNEALTEKLVSYLLKSAMSSTNINSVSNVPTSALLYSLMSDVNNNLSQAKVSTDLFADYSAPTFVRWHGSTLNTPYKAGLTYGTEGFAIVFGQTSGWHTVIAWLKGGRNMWAHYVSEGTDYGWSEYAQRSDLEASGVCIGGIYVQRTTNSSTATTKKFTPTDGNSHMSGLLIVDQNNKTDVYSVGKQSGVQPLLKKSDVDIPTISSNVLNVPLAAWGSVALISFDKFTIS